MKGFIFFLLDSKFFCTFALPKQTLARSSSRLGRQVFILEIRGSIPLRATKNKNITL